MAFRQIEIPIVGGEDTGTEVTAGARPLLMRNCWYQKGNGVVKRYGVTRVDTQAMFEYPSGSLGAPKRVVGTETLTNVCTGLFTSPVTGVVANGLNAIYNFQDSRWVKSEVAPNFTVRTVDATGTTPDRNALESGGVYDIPSIIATDAAYGADRYLVASTEVSTGPTSTTAVASLRISVYRKIDNVLIERYLAAASFQYFNFGADVKVIYSSSVQKFFIFYSDATINVNVLEYNPITDVLNTVSVSTPLAPLAGPFDVDINPSGTKYAITDGSVVKFYSAAHALLGTTAVPAGYIPTSICYGPSGAWIVGLDSGAPGVFTHFISDTTFVLGAALQLSVVDGFNLGAFYSPSRGKAILAWTEIATPNNTVTYQYNSVSAASPPVRDMIGTSPGYGGVLVSKPFEFTYGGTTYTAGFIHTRGYQTDAGAGEVVCCFLPIYVGIAVSGLTPIPIANTALRMTPRANAEQVPSRISFPASDVGTPILGLNSSILARVPAALGTRAFSAETLQYLDLYPTPHAMAVSACGGNFISGETARFYDGNQLFECGFYAFPMVQTATQGVGGNLTLGGSYEYTQTYAVKTSNGHIIRSAPGAAQTVVLTGANNQFSVVAEKINISQATITSNPGYIEFWRTEANRSVLHFEFACLNAITGAAYTAAKIHAQADNLLASNGQIYTQGGALENVPPPSCTALAWHKGRLFVGGTPDDTLWYSKQYVFGEIPGFNEGFTIQPFEGGRIGALASLDSNLIIFKENAIFGLAGDGPDDTGGGITFGVPFNVSADTGCVDPKSVINTPIGVLFRGRRGIYLLDRSMQVSYIGKPIESNLGSAEVITDAILVGRDSQVRFLSSSGEVFVFDYLNGAWSIFRYPETFKYATIYNNKVYMVTDDLKLYMEDPTDYTDGGVWVQMKYRIQYIHADTVQAGSQAALGWQRVRTVVLNGRAIGDCDPTITLYRDYDDSYTESRTFAANEGQGWLASTNSPRPVEIRPGVQKCSAISIEYSDATPSATLLGIMDGGGFVLNSISLEVVSKEGPGKLSPSQVK